MQHILLLLSSESPKENKFLFFPKLPDLENTIAFVCLYVFSCFSANYNAFPIHREKGGPERNLQDVYLCVCVL